MAKRYYPIDSRTLFGEDISVAASGVIKKNATDVVYKIGKGRQEMSLVVNVKTMTTTGNQRYTFLLQGCDDKDFTGPVENLAILDLGAGSARLGGARTSPIGLYGIRVSNDMVDEFEFVRLNVVVAGTGTAATITAYLSEPTA